MMVMATKGDGIGAAVGRVTRKLAGRPVKFRPGDEAVEAEVLAYEKEKLEAERRRRVREELDRGQDGLAALKAAGQRMLSEREAEPEPRQSVAEVDVPPPSPRKRRRRRKAAAAAPESSRAPAEMEVSPAEEERRLRRLAWRMGRGVGPASPPPDPYVLRRGDGSEVTVDRNDPDVGPDARRGGRP
jgi:hypothetical protein